MNGKELIKALNTIVEEKNISADIIFEALELALQTAYKKNFNSKTNVRVDINRETGDIKVYSYYVVVPEIDEGSVVEDEEGNVTRVEPEVNRDAQILLEDAIKKVPTIKVGETIEEEVTPKDFGRVAASTCKQVFTQKVREAERESIMKEFEDKEGELMVGTLAREDKQNYYVYITRGDKEKSNANLKSLKIGEYELAPNFSPDTINYAFEYPQNLESLDIEAIPENQNAKVEIIGNENLKEVTQNIQIKVTAEDETVRTYKIAVTKEKKDQVGLKELLIEGVKLNPDFDANTYLYTVDMENKNLSELNITATANKEKATVEIIGNTNLSVGNNVITILVKESDTETATYQINVNIKETVVAESKNDNDLYKKIGMGVLGAVVLIAIVVTIVKMRKDNDDDEIDYKEEKKSSVKQKDLEEDELPKSLRKHKNEEQEERTEKDKERSRKIDELYSLDDNELAEKRRRGKHF